ncbi:3-ketoacyl-CoA synthase 4-like [Pyrus ussuriensis x Pyrus communis]|uniref:3-ketoacyl-CoA synthase 4-like n=1 Tax=Pyrus ussuriensis x Pyrus communis TaxID=2448454 RepID=A0A5N5I989_9ROSA|nr:3-ketoacyl-CoA synthase 4-like [Pyrus ussuriensis x Pyrus communis]
MVVFGSTVYIMTRPRSVYVVDYSCYKPPSPLQVKYQQFIEHSKLTGDFDESSLEFQRKILERSGLREETYVPAAMHYIPPRPSMAAASEEADQVIFGALDDLFANANCWSYSVRTHCGADEKAFRCVYQEQDDAGKTGVSLSKDLMAIAGGALKTNITTLGPLVLPVSEQLLFFATFVAKKLFNAEVKPYIPDFKLAFDHFCIHAGGRAVIDELEKNLQLLPIHVEASRMTLHRFGNTSSRSICTVWEALQSVKPSPHGSWEDCIHRYPVEAVA